jgi:sugar (pentulose or hexulose) kinase
LFVAVDIGTSGARACAVDLAGRRVAERRRRYRTHVPRVGWAEQDPDDWTSHAVEALAQLPPSVRRRVAGIGLTGQTPTVAPVDRRCRPVGPGLLYRDNRATFEAGELGAVFGTRELHRRTGHSPAAFHVGAKVLWWRRHEPETFRATRWFLQPRDLVLHRLCGVIATDETHADATLFFDLQGRRWAADLFAGVGLDPGVFPPALAPWTVAGTLPRRVAEEAGLPVGIPIVIGAGDSQCAAFGAGVTSPGPVSEMSGSSSCINTTVAAPLDDLRVTHYSHVVPDWFTTEVGLNTTGAAVAWAVRTLGFAGYDDFAEAAAAGWRRLLRRGSDAAPAFLPHLADGERDDPAARGAFVGLSDRHDRAALACAVVEGVAAAVAARVDLLHAAGAPAEELRVAGGGARLDVLGVVKADLLGVATVHLAADTTATGAALLAARATGCGAEVERAVAAALGAGRRFTPTARARALIVERRRWHEQLRSAAATHASNEERP